MSYSDLLKEAERQLTICNACRYCEGFCAVFPAMELRRAFTSGDVTYLAHLCHDCRGCYYACMYAPPHPFAVNIPRIMSALRVETFQRYTWPTFMNILFRNRRVALGVVAACVLGVTLVTAGIAGPELLVTHTGPGAFYRAIPQWVMLLLGLGLGGYWGLAWAVAGFRFWREADAGTVRVAGRDVLGALGDALRMRWLGGGGGGCPYPTELPSHSRRVLHNLVFYGYFAAFASTTSAAVYQDILGRLPPYPVLSLPVLLGIAGGLSMIVGCAGLWAQNVRSDRAPAADESLWGDYLFLLVLSMTNVTGMLTLLLRETRLMGVVLAVHLGSVAALYISGAHGKFIHLMYRFLALVRHQAEQRRAASRAPEED